MTVLFILAFGAIGMVWMLAMVRLGGQPASRETARTTFTNWGAGS